MRDLQGDRCRHASWQALMLGRTMLGERVWDVSRAIDVLAAFEQVDTGRIALTGNSGGGTATWYAACMEPRIRIAAPSCSICGLWPSIGEIIHCHCNYIPNMLRWFDMGDLACLIAPRPLAIAAGLSDAIFPIESTQAQFATIQAIYAAAGAPDACSLHVGEGGHQYYPGLLWPVIDRHMAALR